MKVPFAHASEAEMSRILDFYGVRWEYEPDTFPILWNMDGDVIESFSPDFYLPDLDLYLEMTTLRQKLVRRKNRKLRRLRELYPDLNIKLFYARDFRELMLKYGKIALVQGLSGTSGQVAFPHAAIDGADGAGIDADGVGVGAAGDIEPVVEPMVVAAAGPAAGSGGRVPRRRRRIADPRSVTEGPSIR
jgi:hypoxanthine phosphoribosyltransferase